MHDAFAGKVGRRTVFSISAKHAVDVMAYSAFGELEKEWVLAFPDGCGRSGRRGHGRA
jgi:hypothetical protein